MEGSSSKSGRGSASGKKINKTRRSWSTKEEEVLIACIKDIMTSGWKAENGFKVGYLQILEKSMSKIFPGTDLRAMPHIHSKIHVWRKDYGSLATMLTKSGIGWNDTTKMIEAEDEAWENFVKVDLNARLMRFKSWPYYDDWKEIFGKDRATGENAEDVMDAVNEMMSKEKENDMNVDLDRDFEDIPDDTETMSSCQMGTSGTPKNRGKKRASLDCQDPLVDMLGEFVTNTKTALEDLAHRIGYDQDLSRARKTVFEMVAKMDGLTRNQKLRVSQLLVKNDEDLELFTSLPDDYKVDFVKMKLGDHA